LGLLRICGGAQAFGKIGVLGPVHLTPKPAKPEPNRRAKTRFVLARAGNFG
jgi:hypothetical protein